MTPTEIRQRLHQQIHQLPVDLLLLAADFLDFLKFKRAKATDSTQSETMPETEVLEHCLSSQMPRRNIRGLWANFDADITEDDIAFARQEMWGNFPRDIA